MYAVKHKEVEEIYVKKAINDQLFQKVLNSFSYATKLYSAITDVAGNTLHHSFLNDCEFCRLIKSTATGLERCVDSYARAGEQAMKWREPYVFKCHAGLISLVNPFHFQGKHIGNFICGQVLLWQPEEAFVEGLATELGLEPRLLLRAVESVSMVTTMEIQSTADLILMITNYIAQSGAEIFDFQQKLRRVGSWLWHENRKQNIASNGNAAPHLDADQYINVLESQIFNETRQAHIEEAEALLDKLVLQFFIHSKGKIEIIKGRSIEFISFLTRLATECGVKFEELMVLNDLRLKELDEADTVEKVVLWLLAVGKSLIELIAKKYEAEGDSVLNRVINYIQKNYVSENLSIKEVAKATYITPAYLGRLFKKSIGYSFTEYVNRVRVDKAKTMLRKTDQTTEMIAKNVGFKERSYFCKVFKKYVGLSPNEYRRQNYSPAE